MTKMSRRQLALAGAAAGFSFGFAGAKAASRPAASGLPKEAAAQNKALVKMFGSTSEEPCVWRTRGKVFIVRPDAVIPLVGFRGSETSWWRQVDDDVWMRFPSTLSFFTDLETGEFVDSVVSPLNDAKVNLRPSYIRHKEGEWYTPTGHYYGSMKKVFPKSYPEEPLDLDWVLDGDTIRIMAGSNFPPILPQPSLEHATLFADASEVFDDAVATPIGRTAGWNIFSGSRAPYSDMGVLPGHVIWHFDAVKVNGQSDLDDAYLARARELAPNFDRSPELDEGPSFFERIVQNMRR